MTLGPVMLDLEGLVLTSEERDRLQHPTVGGVILFSRNYENPEQLEALVQEIHRLREPRLLVGVDQEGGRVQRFREGFTQLPAMRMLGDIYDDNRKRAKRLAESCGWLMAAELRAVDIDFSFAPVLDIDRGKNSVIGDRAFHSDPQVIADLAHSFMTGMGHAGMAATGKHYPGHGGVTADSHVAVPVDERKFEDIYTEDILPFERMIHYGLAAIMPAHVIYERVDKSPAGFSPFWLQQVLRAQLEFQGVIFSDDLSMAGARIAGDIVDRARAALTAGCDVVLVCNDPGAADKVLDELEITENPTSRMRLARMHGKMRINRRDLLADETYQQARDMVLNIV